MTLTLNILNTIISNEGISSGEICLKLKKMQTSVSRSTTELKKFGLIYCKVKEVKGKGNVSKHWYPKYKDWNKIVKILKEK
jgi:predicted transcriptional regulator|tara:strand:- start:370 stop:612 length:243 start_codon:yes stop_codon:yes gene_type:complete